MRKQNEEFNEEISDKFQTKNVLLVFFWGVSGGRREGIFFKDIYDRKDKGCENIPAKEP